MKRCAVLFLTVKDVSQDIFFEFQDYLEEDSERERLAKLGEAYLSLSTTTTHSERVCAQRCHCLITQSVYHHVLKGVDVAAIPRRTTNILEKIQTGIKVRVAQLNVM